MVPVRILRLVPCLNWVQDPVIARIRGTEVTWRRSYGTRSKCSGSGKQSTVTDDWEVRVTVPVLSCSEWSKYTEKA